MLFFSYVKPPTVRATLLHLIRRSATPSPQGEGSLIH